MLEPKLPYYQAPKGADVYLDGSFYKIGTHGKVFIYVNQEWVSSRKSASVIKKAILKEQARKK